MLEVVMNYITVRTIVDIAIVSYLFYKVMSMLRQTRAMQLLKGLAVLLFVAFISNTLQLQTVNWLLTQLQTMLLVALPIVFQPELRRSLETIGQGGIFRSQTNNPNTRMSTVGMICSSVMSLAGSHTGMLLVLERDTSLNEYADTGVLINADITVELLKNLFFPNAALHDGAVIIRKNKVYAAGCILPLSENPGISKSLGTRHRAALGLSEVSDAFIIVVSEETGVVSVVESGRMTRYVNEDTLRSLLEDILGEPSSGSALSALFEWHKNLSRK